jgi:hypothetical protein
VIEEVIGWLNHRLPGLGGTYPSAATGIVMGIDKSDFARVTLLLFDEAGRPAAIAKVARRAESKASLKAEHAVLRHFSDVGSPLLKGLVPEPLGLESMVGSLALLESPVRGRPMTANYYRPGHTSGARRVERDFEIAGRWLDLFQRETLCGNATLDERTFSNWFDPVLKRYRDLIGWSPLENELFSKVSERARRLFGLVLPLTGVHGDYWMGNIMVEHGVVTGVVDWELAKPSGLPFSDIYKFPTSYGLYLDRARPGVNRVRGHPGRRVVGERWRGFGDWPNLVGFGYTYFGQGWFPDLVSRFIRARLDKLGLPFEVNSVFFPLFVAEQATVLDDPLFRDGYRSALLAFWTERRSTWLWSEKPRIPRSA